MLSVISSVLQVIVSLPDLKSNVFEPLKESPGMLIAGGIVVFIGLIIIQYYLLMVSAAMAGQFWKGNTEVTREDFKGRVGFNMAFRLINVSIRVSLTCFLGFLLFIIPGIIMAGNRILSFYILILEDTSPRDAIRRSINLMTKEKWYAMNGPLMRVSGLTALGWILAIAAGSISSGASFLLARGVGGLIATVVLMFIAALVQHFVNCFTYLSFAGFYYDLLARYEGVDIVEGLQKFAPNEQLEQPKTKSAVDSLIFGSQPNNPQ